MPEDSKFLDVILEALLVGCAGGGGGYVCPKDEFQIRAFRILRRRPYSCRYSTNLYVVCRHFI